MESLAERVDFLLKLRGLKQSELTEKGQFKNAAFVNDLMRGHKRDVRSSNLAKLALALRTTREFLNGETDDPELPGETIVPPKSVESFAPTNMVRVVYGGLVEAGTFREVSEFEDVDDREEFFDAPDRQFPEVPLFRFAVVGDSMNALKPHPISAGAHIICIDFEALSNRVPLQDGMVVVVERSLDGGQHLERSVKQLQMFGDRVEFWPRSTNQRYKPIIVPMTLFKDPGQGDGMQVSVKAIVRRISNDIPLY